MIDRAGGLLAGYALDRLLGDPRRFHPVAGFGQFAARLERRWYADSLARGALHTAVLVGISVAAGTAAERRHRFLATTVVTWAVVGGRSLEGEATAVGGLLDAGELAAGRQRLTHLVGRDTSTLSADEVARATVESVAENTSDAVVAPLLWGAIAGVPGLMGYRAVNTLDAMIGHRSSRYERFGKAAARLDDLVNLAPSRLAAALAVLLGPDPRAAARAWRRDGKGHPSPNAGPVEAAFAGALGIQLGGTNVYGERMEHRPLLGGGRQAAAADIARSTRLARSVGLAAVAASATIALMRQRREGS